MEAIRFQRGANKPCVPFRTQGLSSFGSTRSVRETRNGPDAARQSGTGAVAAGQKLPPMFSKVSMTTTQSSTTFCITSFMMFSGMATQPPV